MFAPVLLLLSVLCPQDHFCAQIFRIFEILTNITLSSIRHTNTHFGGYSKYEYVFMRHPGRQDDAKREVEGYKRYANPPPCIVVLTPLCFAGRFIRPQSTQLVQR